MRLLGKAATARANAVTSPNMQPLAWCSAADGARRALRVTLVMLRSRQVTMLLATAQLCMHRERMWSCIVTRSNVNKQTMCKCASRCILLTLSERGVCKCSLTSSVSRIPTTTRLQMALQRMHRHRLPAMLECRGVRPFCSVQQQPQRCRRAPCACKAAPAQQQQQLSLDRRQLLAAAAALVAVRVPSAAAYQPPPSGTTIHACTCDASLHALHV